MVAKVLITPSVDEFIPLASTLRDEGYVGDVKVGIATPPDSETTSLHLFVVVSTSLTLQRASFRI